MNIRVQRADYLDAQQAGEIGYLLNCYALDPMGGGTALSPWVRANLARKLSEIPRAFSLICYVDDHPAGLVNCLQGFSTFKCRPLINIHDIAVREEFRGRGISQRLLAEVEKIARERGCCKITLEVLEGNGAAQAAYRKFGFEGYELDPALGKAMFWEKNLGSEA